MFVSLLKKSSKICEFIFSIYIIIIALLCQKISEWRLELTSYSHAGEH